MASVYSCRHKLFKTLWSQLPCQCYANPSSAIINNFLVQFLLSQDPESTRDKAQETARKIKVEVCQNVYLTSPVRGTMRYLKSKYLTIGISQLATYILLTPSNIPQQNPQPCYYIAHTIYFSSDNVIGYMAV